MKEDIKNTIIKSAFELFYTNGYRNTTIRAIAEKSKISHTQIMYHFNSKANLAGEICVGYIKSLAETVQNLEKDTDYSIEETHIIAYWTIHYLNITTFKGFGAFFNEFTQDETETFIERVEPLMPFIYSELFGVAINYMDLNFKNELYLLANIDSVLGRLCYLKRFRCSEAVSKFLSLNVIDNVSLEVKAEDVEAFIFRNNLLDVVESFMVKFKDDYESC